jgi:thiamine biosynthesis protein ThiC
MSKILKENPMNYLKTHIFYIALIAVGIIAGRAWLLEHDARVAAEVMAKQAETSVKVLQQSIADNDAKTAATIAALQQALAKIKTPAQAIAAIPSVSGLPINSRPAIDNPTQVSVDAVPLYQELNQCKQDAVSLNSCQADLKAEKEIVEQKDVEIKALRKKPSFFKRVIGAAKAVGIGIGIGLLLGGHAL